MVLKDGQVSTTDTGEAVGDGNATAVKEAEGVIDASLAEASGATEETEQTATEPQIDWGKHGLPQFAGRPLKEITEHLQGHFRKYGDQANELGELRKSKADYDKLRKQITGEETEAAPPTISEAELAVFVAEFNESPHAAIDKLIESRIDSIAEKVYVKNEEKFKSTLDERDKGLEVTQDWNAFVKNKDNTGWEEFKPAMLQLMTDEYLGDDVPYAEVYKLAKLSKEEKSLFPSTLALMQKGLTFDEARNFASLKQNASANAETKKQQVKTEVASAAGGLKTTAAKQASSEPEIKDMDDARASMNE